MKQMIFALAPLVILSGCNSLQWNSDILGGGGAAPVQASQSDPGAPLSVIPELESEPEGVTVQNPAAVNSSELGAGQGAGAGAGGAVPRFQGRAQTVASLGDPVIPGLWMETSLVTTDHIARLRSANGKVITVTLKPASGDSSSGRLSISAMRALGAPLTELVEVEVLPAG
ncbi:molybdenum cofactor biosynthesis protein A [Roseobacter sp. MED193]|uniref:hypothetical protein n=1 Tax=Roseobacter sp. MED193 TaxID=314262 RepID=UPI000068EE24|nr:hypothetical protein [Roseobacter sp. MED193]EAQ46150.1 molybdenum cofactor biosynthesis protein A [Roseobacter sp. MED193]